MDSQQDRQTSKRAFDYPELCCKAEVELERVLEEDFSLVQYHCHVKYREADLPIGLWQSGDCHPYITCGMDTTMFFENLSIADATAGADCFHQSNWWTHRT